MTTTNQILNKQQKQITKMEQFTTNQILNISLTNEGWKSILFTFRDVFNEFFLDTIHMDKTLIILEGELEEKQDSQIWLNHLEFMKKELLVHNFEEFKEEEDSQIWLNHLEFMKNEILVRNFHIHTDIPYRIIQIITNRNMEFISKSLVELDNLISFLETTKTDDGRFKAIFNYFHTRFEYNYLNKDVQIA